MANTTTDIFGVTRGGSEVAASNQNQEVEATFNNRGDLVVAQALPERAELVRLGYGWGAQVKEANAFTALITIPTTRAELALQNGESTGGKSYLIDRVWVKCVTSLAAAQYLTILAQVIKPGTTLVADSANKTLYSLSGKNAYPGKAQLAVASTAVGAVTDQWTCIGNCINLPTSTTIAAFGEAFVFGRYLIPPQGTFAINAQESVSGGTLIVGVEWFEVQLTIS